VIPGEALVAVPFDHDLDDVFQGEEILYAARLYTHGYDFYTPDTNVVYHHYSRKEHPRFHSDLLMFEKRRMVPQVLVYRKLGMHGHPENYGKYGLGRKRALSGYWKLLKFDPAKNATYGDTCKD